MNIFRIALRSIQHRGLGSILTILSMALGVMLVVSVLSIHGLISDSFRSNSSFGYNILVGARGGGLQLTMNTVYYLSKPVENIPYEYYLAFCDQEKREKELVHSLAFQSFQHEMDSLELCSSVNPGATAVSSSLCRQVARETLVTRQLHETNIDRAGLYRPYTHMAIPLCMGDTYEVENSEATFFRCVGTTPDFFSELELDVDTGEKFKFAEGRCFEAFNSESGYFECVIGALVAKTSGKNLGEMIYPTHGDPNDSSAHIHKQGFKIVGILEGTRTPHDRAVFLNMEGFYLMEGHVKPIDNDSVATADSESADTETDPDTETESEPDEFDQDEVDEFDIDDESSDQTKIIEPWTAKIRNVAYRQSGQSDSTSDSTLNEWPNPLPIEQREVTSILVRTSKKDTYGLWVDILAAKINEGDLESTLNWSNFRPVRAQKASQAVNPVGEVAKFFGLFVSPIQWLLLALTVMICVVSGISILVGIYNSMNQRKHEIAVMRALGASRTKVMSIMLSESILLALSGGLLGWIGGHLLNMLISPLVESKTGVGIGFWDFAPGIPLFEMIEGLLGASFFPNWLLELSISPEFLLIPGLILLAIIVGIYPAISAYRTDVAKALGK